MILCLILCLGGSLPSVPLAAVEGTAEGIPVRYQVVARGQVSPMVELPGTLEAARQATVAAAAEGLVRVLHVREGESVRRGQALAELRSRPIELRIEGLEGELAESEARLQSSRLRLERMRKLGGSEVVSQQRVDDTSYEHQAWEGKVAQVRAELALLRDQLDRSVIRAPFDGVVVAERVQVGEWLDLGAPVVDLVSVLEFEARIEIPESYFPHLVLGSPVEVTVQALPGVRVSGRLRAVVPKAVEPARVFPALVSVPRDPRLGVGMLVRARLPSGPSSDSLRAPADAVLDEGGRPHVFVIDADSSVRRVDVEIVAGGVGQGPGSSGDGWISIRGSLDVGAKVVVRGNEGLLPGQRVVGTPQSSRPGPARTPSPARELDEL